MVGCDVTVIEIMIFLFSFTGWKWFIEVNTCMDTSDCVILGLRLDLELQAKKHAGRLPCIHAHEASGLSIFLEEPSRLVYDQVGEGRV